MAYLQQTTQNSSGLQFYRLSTISVSNWCHNTRIKPASYSSMEWTLSTPSMLSGTRLRTGRLWSITANQTPNPKNIETNSQRQTTKDNCHIFHAQSKTNMDRIIQISFFQTDLFFGFTSRGHLGESGLLRGLQGRLGRLRRRPAAAGAARRGLRFDEGGGGPMAAAEGGKALGFSCWETWFWWQERCLKVEEPTKVPVLPAIGVWIFLKIIVFGIAIDLVLVVWGWRRWNWVAQRSKRIAF